MEYEFVVILFPKNTYSEAEVVSVAVKHTISLDEFVL